MIVDCLSMKDEFTSPSREANGLHGLAQSGRGIGSELVALFRREVTTR